MIQIKKKEIKKISSLKFRKVLVVVFWILLILMIVIGIRNIAVSFYSPVIEENKEVTTEVKKFSDIGITTFSNKFIHSYFSFSNDDNKRKERLEDLKKYMLDDIVNSTARNIENMKGISSKVNGVDFWSIEKEEPLEETIALYNLSASFLKSIVSSDNKIIPEDVFNMDIVFVSLLNINSNVPISSFLMIFKTL